MAKPDLKPLNTAFESLRKETDKLYAAGWNVFIENHGHKLKVEPRAK